MSRILDLFACILMIVGFMLLWAIDSKDDPYNRFDVF